MLRSKSSSARPPRAEADPLRLLGRLLRDSGFWEACRLHRNRYIDRRYQSHLRQSRPWFPAPVRALLDLFLFRSIVEIEALQFMPRLLLEALIDEEILARKSATAVQSGYFVLLLDNVLVLTEDFSNPAQSVYFGEDSEFYANMLEISPGARCLDLCTGTGVQALMSLSRGAARVDAVDINPRAVRLAQLNARLNGWERRLRWFEGDLFEPLPPGRYDRITCNPPLLPIPHGIPYPVIGDGGFDGLRFIRRILEQLGGRLADGGKCLLLGLSLANPVPEIERLCAGGLPAGFGCHLYLLTRQSLDQYLKAIVTTVARLYPKENPLKLSRSFRAAYSSAGYTDVVSYYLVASRSIRDPAVCVSNLTQSNGSETYWFVGGA
ncbi:MAG TPA: methyltransferase [Candidatus Paceibacterota bacterium]|nr:methyltransferase [Verrucomicrobiota bacterium]HRZ93255.1 methyltransferase [Candidatus Paceibacterota bacterium]